MQAALRLAISGSDGYSACFCFQILRFSAAFPEVTFSGSSFFSSMCASETLNWILFAQQCQTTWLCCFCLILASNFWSTFCRRYLQRLFFFDYDSMATVCSFMGDTVLRRRRQQWDSWQSQICNLKVVPG